MAQAQSRRYTIYIDNTEAQRQVDSLKDKARRLTEEISRIQAAGGNATRQMQQLANTQQQIRALETSISSGLTRSLRDLQAEVTRTENLLRRATDPETIRQLNAQLVTARQNLLEYRANVLGIGSAQAQLAAQSSTIFTRLGDNIKASLFGNLLANGVTMLISALQQAISDSIDLAAKGEGIKRAFQQINNPNLLKELRAATRGTVSDLDLMQKAVNAKNFQIPLENLGTYFAFAHQRARATGEAVDYLTSSIVLGISRKSLPILDNLGISATRVREAFAQSGDMAAAVTQIVKEEMSKSGQYVDTYADKVERMGTKWKNAKEAMGVAFITVADEFSNRWDIMFGDEDERQAALDRDLSAIADRQKFMKDYYASEVTRLEWFKKAYGDGTKKGDREILEIAKQFIEASEKQQKQASDNHNVILNNQLSRRLEIWRKFYSDVTKLQISGGDTLGGKKAELELLTSQLDTLDIKSKAFADTQAKIKKLQQEIADADGTTAKKEDEKNKQLAEKDQRHKEQLLKQLEAFVDKYTARQLSGYEREIAESENRYNTLRAQLIKYGIDTDKLDKVQLQERIQILQKYSAAQASQYGKSHDLLGDTPQFRIKKGQTDTVARLMNDIDRFAKDQARRNKDDVDAAELLVMTTHGAKQLAAKKQLLDAQRKQDLANTSLTATERAKIEADYQQKDWDTTVDYYSKKVDQYTKYLGGVLSVYEQWSSMQKAKEDAELAADKALNDKKKQEFKRQLDAKIISQEEYARKVEALDTAEQAKERALKKKQFEREKVANITKAVMGTAQAVVQALTAGPFIGPILAALTGAMGLAQIAIISAQKVPEYGGGGKLVGPAHDSPSNGLPVLDPETGRPVAYVEGGEGIVKRSAMADKTQYTATGTPSQIASAFNSMHGGINWESGAHVKPAWMTYTPKPVNFGAVTSTISNLRAYATGGVFASDTRENARRNDETTVSMDPQMQALLTQNMQVLLRLEQQLASGITAIASVEQINQEQERMRIIRSNSKLQP